MPRFMLVVFTDPIAGKEAEYDAWYNDVHLADVVAIPGVVSAQRFRSRMPIVGVLPNRNLAIYEIDSDDPEKVVEAIYARAGTPEMIISEAIDQSIQNVALVEACSQRIEAL